MPYLKELKAAKFDVMALTVDTITGGNRERDLRTGFTSPPKLTLASLISFAIKPMWGINYVTRGKFELPHLQDHVKEGTSTATCRKLFFYNVRSINELERRRKSLFKMGRTFCT